MLAASRAALCSKSPVATKLARTIGLARVNGAALARNVTNRTLGRCSGLLFAERDYVTAFLLIPPVFSVPFILDWHRRQFEIVAFTGDRHGEPGEFWSARRRDHWGNRASVAALANPRV